MIKGFKEFILRGNVIDLAVAVVIGAAFTALVNAVVAAIINPLIAIFWKPDASGKMGFPVPDLYGGTVTFPIGDLISALIGFVAVAVVVYFVFVYPMNVWKSRQAAKAGVNENAEEPLPTEQELLIQIRDLLEKNQTPKV
ncbi:large conductance mechanosensitive channel protein MscL [Microbacterium sp. W1N]|uniref:large conductance mechanosensitive channel protein MscL n=1 Tax=Microbacterium festucae TaxID=2977531 RepID=UPI0021C23732|nr:large conductance mechanosensitive channel protein MscL [Microbacterium festucae]MCT9821150.1 large conductance mechanosensitive channel protein MscL [Microbacterium festucae]